jgi:hypothetical protein
MFTIYITDQAKQQLSELKTDQGLNKRYKAVKKVLYLLAENPRHKSLQTHEFTSLKGPKGGKVFEAYAEQATSAAYRIFWCYGPDRDQITILSVTKHP